MADQTFATPSPTPTTSTVPSSTPTGTGLVGFDTGGNNASPTSTPTPVVPTTITSANLTPAAPIQVPPTPSNKTATGLIASTDNYAAQTAATLQQQQDAVTAAQAAKDASAASEASVLAKLGSEGQNQLNLETTAGIPQMKQDLVDINNQINSTSLFYKHQIDAIQNGTQGGTQVGQQGAITEIQRVAASHLADLSVIQMARSNNLTAAQGIIDHRVQLETQDLQTQLAGYKDFYDNNSTTLTAAQDRIAQTKLFNLTNQYDTAKYNRETIGQIGLAAAANGADPTTMQNITASKDPQTALAAAGNFLKSGDYSMVFDPNSGTLKPFNSKTGLYADGSTPGTPPQTVAPAQVGKVVIAKNGTQYDLSTYATDPQYATKVQAALATVGTVTDANSAQTAINAITPNSPVTGQMVIDAATKNGIDPSLLIAQMKVESQCCTVGAAVKTNNPGNVGNTDSGATKKFATVADGVNAQAAQLARRVVTQTTQNAGQPQNMADVGSDPKAKTANVQAIKAIAPTALAPGINYIPATGDGYINIDKISDPIGAPKGYGKILADQLSKQYGLPELDSGQVSAIGDINASLSDLNTIQSKFSALAPKTFLGNLAQGAARTFSVPLQQGKGPEVTAYNDTVVEGALSNLKAVTGNSRIGGPSLDISKNSLPVLNVGSGGDTLQTGTAKINSLKDYLNNKLSSFFPGSNNQTNTQTAQNVSAGSTIVYKGTKYDVDAQGNMTPQ